MKTKRSKAEKQLLSEMGGWFNKVSFDYKGEMLRFQENLFIFNYELMN